VNVTALSGAPVSTIVSVLPSSRARGSGHHDRPAAARPVPGLGYATRQGGGEPAGLASSVWAMAATRCRLASRRCPAAMTPTTAITVNTASAARRRLRRRRTALLAQIVAGELILGLRRIGTPGR
jgi:hypothetical protein